MAERIQGLLEQADLAEVAMAVLLGQKQRQEHQILEVVLVAEEAMPLLILAVVTAAQASSS